VRPLLPTRPRRDMSGATRLATQLGAGARVQPVILVKLGLAYAEPESVAPTQDTSP